MDTDALYLHEIKSGTVFLCFDIFFSLILAAVIVIFRHYKWQSFEMGSHANFCNENDAQIPL